jgi:hypothetical protein
MSPKGDQLFPQRHNIGQRQAAVFPNLLKYISGLQF